MSIFDYVPDKISSEHLYNFGFRNVYERYGNDVGTKHKNKVVWIKSGGAPLFESLAFYPKPYIGESIYNPMGIGDSDRCEWDWISNYKLIKEAQRGNRLLIQMTYSLLSPIWLSIPIKTQLDLKLILDDLKDASFFSKYHKYVVK